MANVVSYHIRKAFVFDGNKMCQKWSTLKPAYTKNADLVFRMALCFRMTLVGKVVGVFDGDTVVILTAENTQEKSAFMASMHPRKRRILVKNLKKTYQISYFLKK